MDNILNSYYFLAGFTLSSVLCRMKEIPVPNDIVFPIGIFVLSVLLIAVRSARLEMTSG